MPPAAQVFQMLQQHFQRVQRRRRVFAFQVKIQSVDQLTVLGPVDAQGNGGRECVSAIICGVVTAKSQ